MRISVSLFIAATAALQAQGVITTVAGTDLFLPAVANLPARDLPLSQELDPGLAVDLQGNVYISSPILCQVLRLSPGGIATTAAGNGICGHSGDGGLAVRASIQPAGIAIDRSGNLLIASQNAIRRVAPDGVITTLFSPGPFDISNSLNPFAVDPAGNFFIAELTSNRIRRIAPDGSVTVFAGNGQPGECAAGPSAVAMPFSPRSLAVDPSGNLYVSLLNSAAVCRVSPDGRVTRLPEALRAQSGLAIAPNGDLVVSAPFVPVLYRVSPSGVIRTIAGVTQQQGSTGDGEAADRAVLCPTSVAAATDGAIYVWDTCGRRLRKISSSSMIDAFAGSTGLPSTGEPALTAALGLPFKVAVDSLGNIYVGTRERVLRVSTNGILTSVAGNGEVRTAGVADNLDGQRATSVPLNVTDIAVTPRDELLVLNSRSQLLSVTAGGLLRSVAGDGLGPSRGDGEEAINARIFQANSVSTAPDGSIYITEIQNHRVRRIRPDGVIVNFAGTGTAGPGGDGGLAVMAQLSSPAFVTADRAGNAYLGEIGGASRHRLRVVSPDGIIRTRAEPQSISSLATDAAGNVYVGDSSGRVFRINPDGTLTLFAGGSNPGGLGDGLLATAARLITVSDIAFDDRGNLLIVDSQSRRVRSVLAQPPSFSVNVRELPFSASSGGSPSPPQNISVSSPVAGLEFTVEPPEGIGWVRISTATAQTPRLVEVSIDPANLEPGTYETTLTIRAPLAEPGAASVRIVATIGPASPPRLEAAQRNLVFTVPRTTPRRTLSLAVSNAGGGTVNFNASASTETGGSWLSVTPANASVTAGSPVSLDVMANPEGLTPGTYSGAIIVAGSSGGDLRIPVVLTISRLDTAILLSQTGLSFTAVAGGGVLPPQDFAILNIGTGGMPWSASASTLAGGNWLRLSTAQGISGATSTDAPSIDVNIDQTGLTAGRYFGQVRVDAPDAANSPQFLTVVLDVVRPENSPGSILRPAELIFGPGPGGAGAVPGSMDVLIYNPSVAPVTYRAVRSSEFVSGSFDLLALAPESATIQPDRPLLMTVQPRTTQNRKGTVNLQFSDGNVRSLGVSIVAAPPLRSASLRSADGCTPTRLLPALLAIGQGFVVPAGAPGAVVAEIKDDCGEPLRASGSATLYFSNGDAPLTMVPVRAGRWHGTWQARSASSQVRVRLDAEDVTLHIKGSADASADLRAAADPPLLTADGVVSAAQGVAFQPLAPNAMISVYGERLADSSESASAVPLPNRLGNVELAMAGRRLPLLFASSNQVNAIVPGDLEPNTQHQLVVRRGLTYAQPVTISVAPAQPAVFTTDGRRAIATVFRGSQVFVATPSNPARGGDVVVLYCSGLGPTRPTVPSGSATPSSPLTPVADLVMVYIGGVEVPVAFAGLTPGFVALYQLNLTVPPGLTVGDEVPLIVETLGQSSSASFISLR